MINLACRMLVFLLVLTAISFNASAANVLTPCFLKVSLYTNITGTAVADLLNAAKYPAAPDEVRYLRSFNTRDALPTDSLELFGGRIEGFITPQESAEYHFFLRSDDASQLWLGSDETEASASMIAEEVDSGDAFMESDAGDAATSAPQALVAGKRYFIMVLYKSSTLAGNSTDYAKVAWRKAGDPAPANSLSPIPSAFLSTLADDSKGPVITITQHPPSATAEENAKHTFNIAVTATPTNYLCIQWQRNGVSIPGATGTSYSRFIDKADDGAKFRAVAAVPGVSVASDEAVITVTPDRIAPTLLSAKGGPNRPEVKLTFSERISAASAAAVANYKVVVSGAGGAALNVSEASLSGDGTQVTLKTDAQVPGTQYTVTVNNVADLAAGTANVIGAGNQATFHGLGPWMQGLDGFVVWEAEDYDRNLDGLWVKDTERGVSSGGASMVIYNGAGGSEANSKLEYDIYFTKTGINILWWRFSGNDGNDDSAFVHFDGERPVGRETGNRAGISGIGTSLAGNWGWNAGANEGGGQLTFVVETPGVHSIGIARREDGSFVDKLIITTDPNFSPTAGFTTLGPGVTPRQGEPPLPGGTVTITRHPVSTNGLENTSLSVSAAVTVPAGFLFTYQWQRKQGNDFVDVPGATAATFTLNPLLLSWNGAVVRMRVISGSDVQYTTEATISVTAETTVPELIRATGSALAQQVVLHLSEPVTAASAQNISNYKIESAAGAVSVESATLMTNGLTVVLATGPQTVGTKYTVTANGLADTAATPNRLVNGQIKLYSLGALQPQGEDGLLVFEAENFDRNSGDVWVVDKLRATPSGGASVVAPNGSGSSEANRIEYDVSFTKTGAHIVWYRASSDSGSDDSAWFHFDGARPANRTTANQASMTGYNGQREFVWRSQPQEGGGQMTFNVDAAGPHSLGLALREDGAFFDKFVITTNLSFNPANYGAFGPPETRAGGLPLPSLAVSSPANNSQFVAGAPIPLSVAISATSRVITKVEYLQGANIIGESTSSPYGFTWLNAPLGTNSVTARLTDDVKDVVQSLPIAIIVTAPPSLQLTASLSANGLTLSWTGGSGPYTVQKKSSITDANWVDVATTTETSTTVPTDGQSGFFRVITP